MRILAPILAVVVAAALSSALTWHEHYERGLSLLARGDARGAYAELTQAQAARGEEGLAVHTEGIRYVDYLPNLYLAVAAYSNGNVAMARAHLEAAERSGVAARSQSGRVLLEAYRLLLTPAAAVPPEPPPATPATRGGYRLFPHRPPTLPAEEIHQVASEVLNRCGLPPQTEVRQAPWYFFYEVGLELEARGDPQSALDYLIAAADRRPTPGHLTRSYGMWFLDYRPYFEIARSHGALGNWSCARDALQLSQRMGEVGADDPDFPLFEDLLREVEVHQVPTQPK